MSFLKLFDFENTEKVSKNLGPGCIPCKIHAKGTPSPKFLYARYFQGERSC